MFYFEAAETTLNEGVSAEGAIEAWAIGRASEHVTV
jgi:hypothetical protein